VRNLQQVPDEEQLAAQLQKWADGKATLRDVRGYSNDELYAVARAAYFYFYQGRIKEARTLFHGLYAINPVDPYFAKALGVIEMAAKNPTGALSAYDVAVKLAPDDPSLYVGRAEVKLAMNQKPQAMEDLLRARQLARDTHELSPKIGALLSALAPGRSR